MAIDQLQAFDEQFEGLGADAAKERQRLEDCARIQGVVHDVLDLFDVDLVGAGLLGDCARHGVAQ